MSQIESPFKRAQRNQVRLKIAITGPSGSGKTYSALRLAKGFGGKVAVIDTENGSASLYSDLFEFDTLELTAPFSTEKYRQAIDAAIKADYDVLVIDSISHQWKEILSRKEQLDQRGGNSFTNWGKLTPDQEKFVHSITHSDIHLIATMRSKQEYQIVEGEKGKSRVQKLGLAPVQRAEMEYEFTTMFDVAMNHTAEPSKDRTGLFTDTVFQISESTGEKLAEWWSKGAPVAKAEAVVQPTAEELDRLRLRRGRLDEVLRQTHFTLAGASAVSKDLFGKERISTLTDQEFERLSAALLAEAEVGMDDAGSEKAAAMADSQTQH